MPLQVVWHATMARCSRWLARKLADGPYPVFSDDPADQWGQWMLLWVGYHMRRMISARHCLICWGRLVTTSATASTPCSAPRYTPTQTMVRIRPLLAGVIAPLWARFCHLPSQHTPHGMADYFRPLTPRHAYHSLIVLMTAIVCCACLLNSMHVGCC